MTHCAGEPPPRWQSPSAHRRKARSRTSSSGDSSPTRRRSTSGRTWGERARPSLLVRPRDYFDDYKRHPGREVGYLAERGLEGIAEELWTRSPDSLANPYQSKSEPYK